MERLRTWMHPWRLAAVAAAALMTFAVFAKIAAPKASGLLVSAQVRALTGTDVSWSAAIAVVIGVDLVVLAALAWPRKLAAAFIVITWGLTFALVHVMGFVGRTPVDCGCFGAVGPLGPALAVVTSVLLLAVGFRRAEHAMVPTVRVAKSLGAAGLLSALPALGTFAAPWVDDLGSAPERLEDRSSIAARDRLLFVFSPNCPSCLDAASRLGPKLRAGEAVGITSRALGRTSRFFDALGFEFPVESVTPSLFFSLLDSVPPAYWFVDADGHLEKRPAVTVLPPR